VVVVVVVVVALVVDVAEARVCFEYDVRCWKRFACETD
jgi:hypothetical protein